MQQTSEALRNFTATYCQAWQHKYQHLPTSEVLLGIPSPCIVEELDDRVMWQPQPSSLAEGLKAVEQGIGITLQPSIHAFYNTQFAGDMAATWQGQNLTLLQTWSEEDFQRVQENLLGHLVMKRRLKHSPTLFIATTDNESEIIAVDNLTGEVVLERLGKKQLQVIAESLPNFLKNLQPCV